MAKRSSPPATRPVALEAALDLLVRRPRTAAELRRALEARGYSPQEVGTVLAQLRAAGHVDDARLAEHYLVARAARLGHGRDRLLGELERRGVDRATARAAWEQAVERGDLAPEAQLAAAVERRLCRGPRRLDARAYARMYNALLRAGFEDEAIRRELEPHRAEPDAAEAGAGANDDDFP